MSEYNKEIQLGKILAREAGEIMLKYFNNHDVEFKIDRTPVTTADETINQLVIDRISQEFPDDGVLAEEGNAHENQSRMWVIDPIDGTIPYTYGLPISFFSLGFVIDGEVQFGICYRPFDDMMYFGDGKTATKNDEIIRVNQTASLNDAVFTACFDNNEKYKQSFEAVASISAISRSSLSLMCVVAEAMLVAEGKIEIATYPHSHPYDIAGLKPIIEGAGGKVTNVDGNDQRYDKEINGAIVSNGKLHEQTVEYFRKS
ncbi:inositol monophosphatase [Candidatus Saccharibacteria bacterium]|nr:inositol monophosphatase [Candidatus Saccharibacteria bacterium]